MEEGRSFLNPRVFALTRPTVLMCKFSLANPRNYLLNKKESEKILAFLLLRKIEAITGILSEKVDKIIEVEMMVTTEFIK